MSQRDDDAGEMPMPVTPMRCVMQRNLERLEDIRNGKRTRDQASDRYRLSPDELLASRDASERHGPYGLLARRRNRHYPIVATSDAARVCSIQSQIVPEPIGSMPRMPEHRALGCFESVLGSNPVMQHHIRNGRINAKLRFISHRAQRQGRMPDQEFQIQFMFLVRQFRRGLLAIAAIDVDPSYPQFVDRQMAVAPAGGYIILQKAELTQVQPVLTLDLAGPFKQRLPDAAVTGPVRDIIFQLVHHAPKRPAANRVCRIFQARRLAFVHARRREEGAGRMCWPSEWNSLRNKIGAQRFIDDGPIHLPPRTNFQPTSQRGKPR
jgi:hypothetical protein